MTSALASEASDVVRSRVGHGNRDCECGPAYVPSRSHHWQGPTSEAHQRYQSTWSNLILPSEHPGAVGSIDIREVVKESLREFLPEYLKNAAMVSANVNVRNRPTGNVNHPLPSGGFSFGVPHTERDTKNEDSRDLKPQPSLRMSPAKSRQFDRGSTLLQTPTPNFSHRPGLPPGHDKRVRDSNQSATYQKPGRQERPPVLLFSREDREFDAPHQPSVEPEGSSPTLRVTTSRSLRQPPKRPQGVMTHSRCVWSTDSIFR